MTKRITISPPLDADVSVQRMYQEYLRAMYVLFKSSFVYDTNNQALVASAERVATAANQIRANVADLASLELHAEGAYVNRTLLKLDPNTYDQADYLYTIFSSLRVAAIAALGDTSAIDWISLIGVFKRCVGPGGNFEDFGKATYTNIQLTPTAGVAAANNLLAMTNRFRALRAYASTVIAIADVLDAAYEGRALRPLRIKRPLQEMISLADDAGSLLLSLAHLKRHKLTPQHHFANTAVFTICAARSLGLPRATRCALALSATLHDLGRAVTADGSAMGVVSERRFAMHSIRKLIGSPLASQQMNHRAVVANEVRRWIDRDAEPAGDVPYPFVVGVPSRIVAIAHAYSLLTTPRRERPGLLPDEALRVIMRESGRRYDAVAVKLFVNALGVYPVGSTVALADGRAAIVIEAPQDIAKPSQPRIKIVRDSTGTIVDGEIVDLTSADVQITRCIDGEELEINAPAFLLS